MKNMPEGQSFCEALEADIFNDAFPKSDDDNKKTNDIIYNVYYSSNHVAFTDLTGKFSYCSSRGNKYIIFTYNYNRNAK